MQISKFLSWLYAHELRGGNEEGNGWPVSRDHSLIPTTHLVCKARSTPSASDLCPTHGKWPAEGNHLQMLTFNCLNCFKSFLSFTVTFHFLDLCRHVGNELTAKGTGGKGWHSADCQQMQDLSFPPLVNCGLQDTAWSWEFLNTATQRFHLKGLPETYTAAISWIHSSTRWPTWNPGKLFSPLVRFADFSYRKVISQEQKTEMYWTLIIIFRLLQSGTNMPTYKSVVFFPSL